MVLLKSAQVGPLARATDTGLAEALTASCHLEVWPALKQRSSLLASLFHLFRGEAIPAPHVATCPKICLMTLFKQKRDGIQRPRGGTIGNLLPNSRSDFLHRSPSGCAEVSGHSSGIWQEQELTDNAIEE
jgi:hypothetical protein